MQNKRSSTVDTLRNLPCILTTADVRKFAGDSNMFLYRASKKGYIEKIANGVYANVLFGRKPSVEQVACFVRRPAYISCEWALNHHRVILQVPVVCTCITLSGSVGERNRIFYEGITIEYSRISQRLFRGFESADGVNMAIPEKALADYVYLRNALPFPDEIEFDNLDLGKLKEIVQSFPGTTQKLVNAFIVEFTQQGSYTR
jgi:predicted transcriptional regulator of viral defense system